jgi:hypothetical protein
MSLFLSTVRGVWRPFLLHSLLVLFSACLAAGLPAHGPAGFINPHIADVPPLAAAFIKWDAHWYTYIALQGYDEHSVVFFPALVVLIRGVAGLGLGYAASGLLVCNLFAFLSFVAMRAAFRRDFSATTADRALLAYAVMPTSFFLNSVYTEPLFLTFALTCVYFSRRGDWWPAGGCAALAALTRSVGVFLCFVVAYELFINRQKGFRLTLTVISPALAPAALLAFMVYNAFSFGDPLAFVHSQQAWGRSFGWPVDNYIRNLCLMGVLWPNTQAGIALDTFLVTGGFVVLGAATFSRRLAVPVSYLLIGWLWLLVPLFSTAPFLPLYSMSRFLLVVFPLYIVFANMPKALFICFLIVNALLLSLCTILFVNWYWIG